MLVNSIYHATDLAEKIRTSGLLGEALYCRVLVIMEDGNIIKAIFITESGCDNGNTIYYGKYDIQMLCDECLIDRVRQKLQIVAIGQMIADELKLNLSDVIVSGSGTSYLKFRDARIVSSKYLR